MLSHTPILASHVDVPKASLRVSSFLLRGLGTRNEAQRALASVTLRRSLHAMRKVLAEQYHKITKG